MNSLKKLTFFFLCLFLVSGCGIYSFTGGQYSGARTFSVDYIRPQTALATPSYSQKLTETLKDLLIAQSPLRLVETDGELHYSGVVTGYDVTPVAIQGGEVEQASLNRLTITIKIKYTNSIENELSFDRSFSKFADYDPSRDLFSVEEELWRQINEQLSIEIFNASVGNW